MAYPRTWLLAVAAILCVLSHAVLADVWVDDFQAVAVEAELTSTTVIDTVSAGECEPSAGGRTGKILGGCHVAAMRGIVSEGCSATASVGHGVFRCDNGPDCAGECTLQLDGPDISPIRSLSLGVDLLALGSGFRFFARSNIGSAFTFRVYTTQSEISRAVRNVPSGDVLTEFAFNFARDFAGSANFSAVRTIEIEVPPEAGKYVEFLSWQIISPFVEITGQVFEDCSCDGTRTVFDVPVAGATVQLTGAQLCRTRSAEATTDANGVYSFTDLLDCDYEVSVPESVGTLCDGAVNPLPIQLRRDSVSQRNFAVDSGCRVPGGLRGSVFEDVGCDGLRPVGEIGLAGITVTVSNAPSCSTPLVETTVTGFDGGFEFLDLAPCDYTVTIPSHTANLCPGTFDSQTVTVDDGLVTEGVQFRARAPGVTVLDDLLASTGVAQLGDTLGVARQVFVSSCDATSGGVAGSITGGCHVVSVTGVGSNSCKPSGQVRDGGLVCTNPVACGAKCRLLLDGVSVNGNIEFGLEEDLLALGDAMRVSAYSTAPVRITATVYSNDGASSQASFTVPGFGDEATFDLNFLRAFSGDADFSDVGALTLEVNNKANTETVVTSWSIIDSVSADISGTVFQDCTCDLFRDGLTDPPVEGVTVTLEGAVGCPIQLESTQTDEFGRYSFKSLPPCTYVVSLEDGVAACEGGLSERTINIGRDGVFGADFGLDFATLECPLDTTVPCGALQPAVAGEPKVCGVPEGYTFTDDITCRGSFDNSITHITRTFSAAGLTCAQEVEVVEQPLDPLEVDPFTTGGNVLRIEGNETITVSDVVSDVGSILGGIREVVLVGRGSDTCEPLAGAVPQLALSAVPPCEAAVTARYDGNAELGLNYDLNLNLTDLGEAFLIKALANSARSITVRIYSSPSELSQVVVNTLAGQETDFVIEWALFNGNADIERVKALEMFFSTDGAEVVELVVIDWSIVASRPPVSITGSVFRDENCNRVQDTGERALGSVQVRLQSACGGERIVRTTANGVYTFEDLVPCDAIIVSLVDESLLLCDVPGNEPQRVLQTSGGDVSSVNFAVGCDFANGQVCGDRCTPFGDPLPDGTFIEALPTCGTGECQSTNGFVQCVGGIETVVCPTNGRVLATTTCGRGRCEAQGRLQCQGGEAVDTCELPRDGTIVDNCGSGEGPCPGLGQVLCINGFEVGSCTYRDYTLQQTSCGEGFCAGRGELRCSRDGSISDTCEVVSDGEVVSTPAGLRVCQNGQESAVLEPCDIIDCSDGDACTADSCNSLTSDCDHELPEFCSEGGSSAVLHDVFRACGSVRTSTYTYRLRFYEENTPDHVMMCLGPADNFVAASNLYDVSSGETVCSVAPMQSFDSADVDTGIQGVRLTCVEDEDLRGRDFVFSVTLLGTYFANDANADSVIAVKEGLMFNDYDYHRVIGPFDCDCVRSDVPNAVQSLTTASTDGTCSSYAADSLCSTSTPLAISIVTPVRNAAYDLDERLFELQLAELLRVTRYSVQVDAAEPTSDNNARITVIVRLFGTTSRSSQELASIVQDLLVSRSQQLRGTLFEGAFLTSEEDYSRPPEDNFDFTPTPPAPEGGYVSESAAGRMSPLAVIPAFLVALLGLLLQ